MKAALAFLLALVLSLTADARAADVHPKDHIPVFVFEQSGDAYGRSRTTICDVGLKIEIQDSDSCVISNAPSWKVMFFNKATKKCMALSKDDWLKHSCITTFSALDWDRTKLSVIHPRTDSRFGLAARVFSVAGNATPNGFKPHPRLRFADYVDAVKLVSAKQPLEIMQKCLSTPFSNGVPLELVNHAPQKKFEAFRFKPTGDQTYLRTLSFKRDSVERSFFEYPKTYVPANSEVEVLNDARRQKQSDEIFRDFLPPNK